MMNRKLALALACSVLGLAACGGGGGGTAPMSSQVTGTVATGAALASVDVNAYNASGSVCASAKTDASGNFTMDVSGCTQLPVLVAATYDGALLDSVLTGGPRHVDITPLTTLVVNATLAATQATPPTAVQLAALVNANTAAEVQRFAVQAELQFEKLFPNSVYGVDWNNYDLFGTPFTAGSGQGMDAVLDAAATQANSGSVDILNTSSGNGIEYALANSATTPITHLTKPYYVDFAAGSVQPHIMQAIDAGTGPVFSSWGGQTFTGSGGDNTALNYAWSVPYPMPSNLGTPQAPVNLPNAVQLGANVADPYMPAVLMVCQSVDNAQLPGGIPFTMVSGSSQLTYEMKDTDVFVTTTAQPITEAALLANQTFSLYEENCEAGDTYPPQPGNSTLSFDANGNATLDLPGGQILTASAAQMTAALNGTGLGTGDLQFSAFALPAVSAGASRRLVLIEHGGNTPHVGVWMP